jgi:hypothetical protein
MIGLARLLNLIMKSNLSHPSFIFILLFKHCNHYNFEKRLVLYCFILYLKPQNYSFFNFMNIFC